MMIAPTKEGVLRGNDPTGHGYYGAKRGNRKHKGLDIIAEPGEQVISPIDGYFKRVGRVYRSTSIFTLIEIVNETYAVKLMYVAPEGFRMNAPIYKGQVIGKAQDISSHWGGNMTNHVHMEVKKNGLLTDPEPLIGCNCENSDV